MAELFDIVAEAGETDSSPAAVALRPLVPEDAAAFHRLINDWEICRLLPEAPFPYPDSLARERIAAAIADRAAGRAYEFAVIERQSGAMIGTAGLRMAPRHGRSAELGYWIGRRHWRQGLGRAAAAALLAWGFAELPIETITATVAAENTASLALLRGLGFGETGTGRAKFICRPTERLPVVHLAITREALARDQGPAAAAPPGTKIVLVVACAMVDTSGRVLLARRPKGKKLAGLWEFPGGKLAPGETPEAGLARELREELAISVREADLAPFAFASHAYDDFHLLMPLYLCRRWAGTPDPREGQALAWVEPSRLEEYPMPPADRPLIPLLRDFL